MLALFAKFDSCLGKADSLGLNANMGAEQALPSRWCCSLTDLVKWMASHHQMEQGGSEAMNEKNSSFLFKSQ